jgi:multidrug efflux pump subunit AcrB
MNFRNISAWAIRNPISPLVLFAALTLAGIVSFIRMDVNDNPDVEFPAAQIVIVQPGAAPTELETQVTQRVEAAVRGITGVDEVTSVVSEGNSNTMVQFTIGTPVDRAVNDVREAVTRVRSELPEGILEPQVTRIDIAGGPIAYFSVEAVDMTLEQLSWFVDDTVAKRLLGIEGMAQVRRGGGVSREIRVILDPVKLQAQGLTAVEVNNQLRQVNLNAAGGRVEIAGSEQSMRVLGNAIDARSLGDTQISVGAGRTIRLADIAEVRDLYAEQRALSTMNGRQVLSFAISKAKGYSDVTVYDQAIKAIDKLRKENPKVKFTQLFTTVDYVKGQYHSAIDAMIEGAVLAVLVVFLFLRDWRATAISALAIPLSAIPTFWFMDLMGFTLNGLSLLALSLVAGVLVDDAIVEIENIVRHMRMGKTAYQAAIDAADEIGLAVLATTMSIVAVFLPVGLMPGISGQFFKNFGLTVVAAVLMSLAVARLITPMIAAYFLKSHGSAEHGEGRLMDLYVATLRWTLVHRWKTVMVGVGAFVATILAFYTLPLTFQPSINTDYSQVAIEMAPGTTVDQTRDMANRVALLLQREPEVEAAFADIEDVGKANIYLTLRKDRKRTSVEFERATAPKLHEIPDARINFQSQSGGGMTNGRDLNVTLVGNDPVTLNEAAQNVVRELGTLPEVRAPRINGDLQRPEITIKPRLDLAADLGVTTAALSQTIRIATLGDIDQNVAKFSLSDRQIPIRVSIAEEARRSLSTIQNMPVPTANGGSVPLKVVADISFGAGPSAIRRYNQERRISIGADLAPGLVSGDAQPKIDAMKSLQNLPPGVEKVNVGDAKWQAELFVNFIIAVISGVLMVFAVLVLLYKRILPPLVNMGSLLLAPLGGAIALHLTGNAVSMPVLIGLLMLLGIVAKNSILLVDFAIEEISKGVEKNAAIMDAGHKRAQPIVMTTVAMVAGMVPIALSLSGDGSWRAPMGITVIGGLILSTLLTLLIIPPSFSIAEDIERWLGPRLGRWFTNGGEKGHDPALHPAE